MSAQHPSAVPRWNTVELGGVSPFWTQAGLGLRGVSNPARPIGVPKHYGTLGIMNRAPKDTRLLTAQCRRPLQRGQQEFG